MAVTYGLCGRYLLLMSFVQMRVAHFCTARHGAKSHYFGKRICQAGECCVATVLLGTQTCISVQGSVFMSILKFFDAD